MQVCNSSSSFYPQPLLSPLTLPSPSHRSVSHIDVLLFCLWSIGFSSLSICVNHGHETIQWRPVSSPVGRHLKLRLPMPWSPSLVSPSTGRGILSRALTPNPHPFLTGSSRAGSVHCAVLLPFSLWIVFFFSFLCQSLSHRGWCMSCLGPVTQSSLFSAMDIQESMPSLLFFVRRNFYLRLQVVFVYSSTLSSSFLGRPACK